MTSIAKNGDHTSRRYMLDSHIDCCFENENTSEGNLCTIWGLWEMYEGVEGVREYIWLLNPAFIGGT